MKTENHNKVTLEYEGGLYTVRYSSEYSKTVSTYSDMGRAMFEFNEAVFKKEMQNAI